MPTIRFKMRDQYGAPIANTWFKVEPGYQDSVPSGDLPVPVEFYTNGGGDAVVTLVAGKNPYFITKQNAGAPDQVAFKFFVPASTQPLEAEVLYVDLSTNLRLLNDKSLAALVDAKVQALAALSQIKLISSVILPGSEGLQEMVDQIAALEATVAALDTALRAEVSAAVAKSNDALVRANQAIATVSSANANSLTAARLAEQAHEVAVLADQHANEGKALGQSALAQIVLLSQRVTALGG
jgi:hypothetical protein